MQMKIVSNRALSIGAAVNADLGGKRLVCLMAKITRPSLEDVRVQAGRILSLKAQSLPIELLMSFFNCC